MRLFGGCFEFSRKPVHSEFSSFAVKHDACAPDGHISGLQDGKSHSSVLTRSEGIFSVVSSTAFWGEKEPGWQALAHERFFAAHTSPVAWVVLDAQGSRVLWASDPQLHEEVCSSQISFERGLGAAASGKEAGAGEAHNQNGPPAALAALLSGCHTTDSVLATVACGSLWRGRVTLSVPAAHSTPAATPTQHTSCAPFTDGWGGPGKPSFSSARDSLQCMQPPQVSPHSSLMAVGPSTGITASGGINSCAGVGVLGADEDSFSDYRPKAWHLPSMPDCLANSTSTPANLPTAELRHRHSPNGVVEVLSSQPGAAGGSCDGRAYSCTTQGSACLSTYPPEQHYRHHPRWDLPHTSTQDKSQGDARSGTEVRHSGSLPTAHTWLSSTGTWANPAQPAGSHGLPSSAPRRPLTDAQLLQDSHSRVQHHIPHHVQKTAASPGRAPSNSRHTFLTDGPPGLCRASSSFNNLVGALSQAGAPRAKALLSAYPESFSKTWADCFSVSPYPSPKAGHVRSVSMSGEGEGVSRARRGYSSGQRLASDAAARRSVDMRVASYPQVDAASGVWGVQGEGCGAAAAQTPSHMPRHQDAQVAVAGGLGRNVVRMPTAIASSEPPTAAVTAAANAAPALAGAGAAYSAQEPVVMEVVVEKVMSPVTKSLVLLVSLQDISARAALEAALGQMAEGQLAMTVKMFPMHILAAMAATAGKPGHDVGHPSGSASSQDGAGRGLVNIEALARPHEDVTLLFMDIAGFTAMSKTLQAHQVMGYINQLFSKLDDLAEVHGVHKVETAGDCYIVSAGAVGMCPDGFLHVLEHHDPADSARRVLAFAKDMLAATKLVPMPHTGQPTSVRIGLHTGPCASGLVGSSMPKFSLFGDSMNTASRMESTCPIGRIQVSEATRALLPQEQWEATGGVAIKGKGYMQTYLLVEPASFQAGNHTQLQSSPSTQLVEDGTDYDCSSQGTSAASMETSTAKTMAFTHHPHSARLQWPPAADTKPASSCPLVFDAPSTDASTPTTDASRSPSFAPKRICVRRHSAYLAISSLIAINGGLTQSPHSPGSALLAATTLRHLQSSVDSSATPAPSRTRSPVTAASCADLRLQGWAVMPRKAFSGRLRPRSMLDLSASLPRALTASPASSHALTCAVRSAVAAATKPGSEEVKASAGDHDSPQFFRTSPCDNPCLQPMPALEDGGHCCQGQGGRAGRNIFMQHVGQSNCRRMVARVRWADCEGWDDEPQTLISRNMEGQGQD